MGNASLPSSRQISNAILFYLRDQRRAVPTSEIYGPIARILGLTGAQLALTVPSDDTRSLFENRCQGIREQLAKSGHMNRAPYAVWSLTKDGEIWADQIRNQPSIEEEFG